MGKGTTLDHLLRTDFHSWLKKCYVLPDGSDYSFRGFEYLEAITKHKWRPHDQLFFEKPAQVGLSEILLALIVWMNDRNLPKWRGVGYFFPARAQLQDHIKARFLPMFDYETPKSLALRSKLGQQNLRYVSYNKKPLYFRSGQTRRELISIALDCAVIDEFDEFENPIAVVPTIEARFGQSDYGFLVGASTPTIPEIGIDAAFAESNQHNWYVKCEVCYKAFSPLVELKLRGFESCVDKDSSGHIGFVCPHCHELTQTNGKPGEWVLDESKNNQKYAYGISKLFTPRHSLTKIYAEYENTANPQEFYNSTLGIAYAAANARLTASSITECCIGPENHFIASEEATWCGIDVGKKCHWVVGKITDGKKQVIAYGSCGFEELKVVCTRFNVKYLVIDLRPYEHEVKKFISGKRTWMACDFNTGNQEDLYKIMTIDEDTRGDTLRIVKADKTQLSDLLINEIAAKKSFIFPSSTRGDLLFKNQMCAPVRMDKTNKDTGDTKALYGNGGRADHYFYACAYLLLAFQLKRGFTVRLSNKTY
jgi:Phage terminase large subunit (GpA)